MFSSMFVPHALKLARHPLAAADALLNRLYTWRFNPLYQSGTLVVVAFLVMLVTGLYLLLFYRIGSPYESILRIEDQVWAGSSMRAMHRYAADLAVVAAAFHAFRMLVQGRSWGPRALAWVSGWVLLFLMFVCGWTGYVMLWDEQAQLLAVEGARLLDALPIFSEPIARTFVGDKPLPSAFFFLNLFLHVALPIGVALGLWLHLARVARPVMLPPPELLWTGVALLFVVSLVVPAPLGPKADLGRMLGTLDLDWFYSFWLPASRRLDPVAAWLVFTAFAVAVCVTPFWTRPARDNRPAPSVSPGRLCTGCDQCTLDCPYEAIAMIELADLDLGHPVARVDASLCVSCGICAASCAPMAIGPPEESGRDELARVNAFLTKHRFESTDVVLVACENGAGRLAGRSEADGAAVYPVSCIGHLHTSVIEYLLRSGVGGVLLASCPPRDCWHREGPKWLRERVYEGREAELRESVDRRRLQIVHAGEGECGVVLRGLGELRDTVASLERAVGEESIELETECEPAPVEAAS
jgi:ferredoxin/coenzyme F420-reducing hydrogenase delta subunit